jgi:hypothetical protein
MDNEMNRSAIAEVEDSYEFINYYYYHHFDQVIKQLDTLKLRATGIALFRGIQKIDAQLDVLLKSNEMQKHYVNRILFRTIYEHFLISYYIATRSRVTKTDEAALEYYGDYKLHETIRRVFEHVSINELKAGIRREKNTKSDDKLDYFNQVTTGPDVTAEDKKRAKDVYDKFKGRQIIDFLIHELENDPMQAYHETLIALLNSFNVTSSNVHGGPSGELEIYEPGRNENVLRQNDMNIAICKYCSYQIKFHLLGLINWETGSYNELFEDLDSLKKLFLEARVKPTSEANSDK